MEDVYVRIGKVYVASGNVNLHALLGSCVGIGLLCAKKNVYGLAHCLLPNSPSHLEAVDTRYVDHAVDELLRLMKIGVKDRSLVSAVIAGGGNMTKPDVVDSEKLIGSLNIKMATTYLKSLNVKVVHQESGGLQGRKISVYCASNDYGIKEIPRNSIK